MNSVIWLGVFVMNLTLAGVNTHDGTVDIDIPGINFCPITFSDVKLTFMTLGRGATGYFTQCRR